MSSWEDASDFRLDFGPQLLSLPGSLDCGQAFRWRYRPDGWWTGVVRGRVLRLRREGSLVNGQLFPPLEDASDFAFSYLRLGVDLDALYGGFSAADSWMAAAVSTYAGLRVLDQEPQETLLSYVCSTANSVLRISRSVDAMSRRYGQFIGKLEGEDFYAFPTAERLADAAVEELWSGCGLGWRGANLQRVASQLMERPHGWLENLRGTSYREAKAELMQLHGVGAKIADCVCLFALGKDQAVPVDTHIWAVAREIFDTRIVTRTLTPATYEAVAALFVDRYGPFAGWAQEYLYLQRRAGQGRVASFEEMVRETNPGP